MVWDYFAMLSNYWLCSLGLNSRTQYLVISFAHIYYKQSCLTMIWAAYANWFDHVNTKQYGSQNYKEPVFYFVLIISDFLHIFQFKLDKISQILYSGSVIIPKYHISQAVCFLTNTMSDKHECVHNNAILPHLHKWHNIL